MRGRGACAAVFAAASPPARPPPGAGCRRRTPIAIPRPAHDAPAGSRGRAHFRQDRRHRGPSKGGARSMTLGEARIQRFLATKDVAILATVQADGAPLAMPMWFLHAPSSLTMISVADTQKVRNLRRDARVSVVAEAVAGSGEIRGVTVQGRAEFLAEGPERRALIERFHEKYRGLVRLWGGKAMPANRVMFSIVPSRVRSWGLG